MKIKFIIYILLFGLGIGIGIVCSYTYFTMNCSAIALNLAEIVTDLKGTENPNLRQEKIDFVHSKILFTLDINYWANVNRELKKMSCKAETCKDDED